MVNVIKKLREKDRKPIGTYHDIPLHNTELYVVRYHNGELAYIEDNIIADNMFGWVYLEGYHFQLVENIQDHYIDLFLIPQEQGFIKTRIGNLVENNMTCGWEILVEFKDG